MKLKTAAVFLALAVMMTGCAPAAPSLPDESIERFSWEPDTVALPQDCTIAQLCEEAQLVVVGRVTDLRNVAYPTEKVPDRYCSHATVKIEEVLLGETDKRKIDVQDAWYIDKETGIEVTAWGTPLMRKGHRVLLFLKDEPYYTSSEITTPVYTALHAGLGKFFADEQGLFYPAPSLTESYKTTGRAHATLDNMEPRTLDEIRKEIAGA
ncbi:MAG: hypothetical protein IJC52_01595 [Clostridia bacterium]|nr:hypothetical protein [Clostridia bacterium]